MEVKRVGLILIGDELLTGSRQDKHTAQTIAILKKRGMALAWTKMIADEQDMILSTLAQTIVCSDIIFSFGGIGATPDDLTRACAATAFGLRLIRHPQAVALLEQRFGEAAYPNRIRMAELPNNCSLIPNPINQVPGFKIANHHFLPGFPNMAWPMIEWVLDTHYPHYHHLNPQTEQRWVLSNVAESDLVNMMEQLLSMFPEVRLSSLPSTTQQKVIDFGLKGAQEKVAESAQWLETQLQKMQVVHQAI